MKVRILSNLGSNDWPGMPWMAGEVHEVSDKVGAKMIFAKAAEEVVEEPPPEPAPAPPAKEPEEPPTVLVPQPAPQVNPTSPAALAEKLGGKEASTPQAPPATPKKFGTHPHAPAPPKK